MKRKFQIPQNFYMGASASAWQTEGWAGKGEGRDSWADAFYKAVPSRWHNGIGTIVATDFYNRYREDIGLMKTLGLTAHRTSIQWPRFMLDPIKGIVDEEAVKFYEDVIDAQIEAGVEPMICLEHWEIPDVLVKEIGGWTNHETVGYYHLYVQEVLKRFSSKVKTWFTFNEPAVPNYLGYGAGLWYPFKADTKAVYQANYHKILATAQTVEFVKSNYPDCKVGIILNLSPAYPRTQEPEDLRAAHMAELLNDGFYLEPLIHGRFDPECIETLKKHKVMFTYSDEELETIRQNTLHILGVNYYQPNRVRSPQRAWHPETSFEPQYYYENWAMPGVKMNPSRGWEIYGKGLYDISMNIKNHYRNIPWIICENGMGVENEEKFKRADGEIQDDYRIDYVSDHLRWLFKGVEEGSACFGYLMWAFTDNVSPMNSFKNRYGYIEIDLADNRNRRIKKSGHWITETLKNGYFEYDGFEPEYK